jgi:hypothetical protein
MSIKIIAAATLFAVSLATAAFAQPIYSDDYNSEGIEPAHAPAKTVLHYSNRKAPEYSDDYNDEGIEPVHAPTSKNIDVTKTASIKSLPDCHGMVGEHGKVHTRGGDSGASRMDACRATH